MRVYDEAGTTRYSKDTQSTQSGASGYGVPSSDYSKEMQARQGPSYGKTELRDIGGGMQQYYALNMASGQWEPIGRPMPKTGAAAQISGSSISVTTPNGTDVTFGPNMTVTREKHVDSTPAPVSKDFEAFRYQEEVQTLGGGKQTRDVYVLPMDTRAVYNPGYNEKSPGYNRLRVAKTETGIDLRQGYYDPATGEFIITAPVKNLTPGQTGNIDNLLGLSSASTGGMTRGSFNADNSFFDKAVAAKVDDAQTNNSNAIADMVFGKKASAQDAIDFSYGPNTNIIKTPKLTELNVPKVTDNPMPSVGVGELRAGGNPIDVGKDPLGVVGVIIPRSSPIREKFFPETFEKSSQMKFNEKLLNVGPKDPYWQTQEGKSLEQSANQELAFSVAGAGSFAPTGLGRGVSLTKDIIPKVPVVNELYTGTSKAVSPYVNKVVKPISYVDNTLQSGYEKAKTTVIETYDTLPQKFGEKIGVDLTDDAAKASIDGPAPFNMQTNTIPGTTRTLEPGVYKPSGVKSMFKKGETQGYLVNRETVVSTPQTAGINIGPSTAPGLYNPVEVEPVWVSKKAYESSIKAGGEIGHATPMSYESYVKTYSPTLDPKYDLSGTQWSFTKGPLGKGRALKPYVVPYNFGALDIDPAKYMFMKGGLKGRKNIINVLETDAVSPPWVNTRPSSPHVKSKPSFEKAQSTNDDIITIMNGERNAVKTSTTRKTKISGSFVNPTDYIMKGTVSTGAKSIGTFKTPAVSNDFITKSFSTKIAFTPKIGPTVKTTPIPDTDYIPDTTYIPEPKTTTTPKATTITAPISIPAPKSITNMRMGGGIPIVPFSMGAGGSPTRRKAGRKTKALWQNDIEQFNPLKNNNRKGVKKIKSNRKIKSRNGRR